jgi:YgiT-type zinc finger domain-containing protein
MHEGPLKCGLCNGITYEDTVKMSLWEGDRLVVVEDVPARVCEKCAEQYYDDLTVHRLDALRGRRFPVSEAKKMTEVAVFSLPEINVAPKPAALETEKTG